MINAYAGDLSQSYQLRRDTARIKSNLDRLTGELSSGVTTDVVGRLKGNFGPLSGIERGLARVDSYQTVIAEQNYVVSSIQNTLSSMRSLGEGIRDALLTFPNPPNAVLINNAGSDALTRLDAALGALNTQSGGIALFAGTASDGPAVADLETIMSALEAEITLAGATTAADVETIVDAWFTVGGGYDTIGYIGGDAMAQGAQLSDNETLPANITAEADGIRDFLGSLSLAGLLGRNLVLDDGELGALAQLSGERLLDAERQMVELQSSVGLVEAQIERATVEISTERDSLRLARAELIEIDPFEAAVELQNAETQLQTLYSITARLSRLSLANYL